MSRIKCQIYVDFLLNAVDVYDIFYLSKRSDITLKYYMRLL
jgi:hypothetical protein